jgi:hypothetical protein
VLTPDTSFTLVLGGGGMKGLAHVGVLQALVERGLRPSHIVGSSIGALVGAAWASGVGVAKLRDLAVTVRRRDIFRVAHADMALKRMSSPALFRREPLEELIESVLGKVRFSQLDPPVVINTVDVNSGMQVFWGLPGLDDVPVGDAVFASCALPGYLPPRDIRGRFYVAGAVVDNLLGVSACSARAGSGGGHLRVLRPARGHAGGGPARVYLATEIAMNACWSSGSSAGPTHRCSTCIRASSTSACSSSIACGSWWTRATAPPAPRSPGRICGPRRGRAACTRADG